MSKDGFVFYKSFADAINRLDEQEQLQAYKALIDYGCYGIEHECTGMVGIIFDMAKPQIDANNRRYENGKKGAKYGKLGGRPKKQSENPIGVIDKNPIGVFEEKPKAKESRAFIPPSIEQVRAYCASRHNNVDAEAFVDFYSSKGWMIGKNKMKDWKSAVRTWERGDNRGAKVSKIEIDPKLRAFQASNEVVDWGM
jgi:hypothetical protein